MGRPLEEARVREIARDARRKTPPFIPTEPLEIAALADSWLAQREALRREFIFSSVFTGPRAERHAEERLAALAAEGTT